MEKSTLLPQPSVPAPKRQSRWPLLLAVLTVWCGLHLTLMRSFHHPPPPGIAWSTCPDMTEFQCGYLSVPMRWDRPAPNQTVSIALRKLPATAPIASRKGALLINPGGPGGSGHLAVARFGQEINVIVKGQYDIIGFDPRGVNMTTPALDCYQTHLQEIMSTLVDGTTAPELPVERRILDGERKNISIGEQAVINRLDARSSANGEQCQTYGNIEMLRSVSTAFVARDMLAIIDALGQKKLHYWGFSYGTILGATFAAMFPDRVGRLVVDGVSDSPAYVSDLYDWGAGGMEDNDKVFHGLLGACADAGEKRCALAASAPGENVTAPATAASLRSRYDALVRSLTFRPLPFTSKDHGSGVVTASTLQWATFHTLYKPADWPRYADAVAAAERGEGEKLWRFVNGGLADLLQKRKWDGNVFHRHIDNGPLSATMAILCGDTDREGLDLSLETYSHYFRTLGDRASVSGESWALWLLQCRHWRVQPYETFRGPYDLASHNITTSFPVLFVGNTADPVTPLSAAKKMSKLFGEKSASLLIHDGWGHCSISHPSLCSALKIRNYFLEGEVPEYGTTCKADDGFLFPPNRTASVATLGKVDSNDQQDLQKLSEALVTLSERGIGRLGR